MAASAIKLEDDAKPLLMLNRTGRNQPSFSAVAERMAMDSQSAPSLLNNLEAGVAYTRRIKSRLQREARSVFMDLEDDQTPTSVRISSSLSGFDECAREFELALQSAQSRISMSLRLRARGLVDTLAGAGSVVRYDIEESDIAHIEQNDPFLIEVVGRLGAVIDPYLYSLTPSNFETVLGTVVEDMTRKVEVAVLKKRFTVVGALKFDEHVRALLNFFSVRTSRSVASAFARLQQIALVLCAETPNDIVELWKDESLDMFSAAEVRRLVSSARSDIPKDRLPL